MVPVWFRYRQLFCPRHKNKNYLFQQLNAEEVAPGPPRTLAGVTVGLLILTLAPARAGGLIHWYVFS